MIFRVLKFFNRPMSPHLSIYSAQISSIFSIWHRISGIALAVFLLLFLTMLKFLPLVFSSFNTFFSLYTIFNYLWIINSIFSIILIFIIYHLLSGLRHISWDLGFFLTLTKIKISSFWIILIVLFLFLLNIIKIKI